MATYVNSPAHYSRDSESIFAPVARFFSMFRAAAEAAHALENRRQPSAAALKTLGIAPDAFTKVSIYDPMIRQATGLALRFRRPFQV